MSVSSDFHSQLSLGILYNTYHGLKRLNIVSMLCSKRQDVSLVLNWTFL